MRRFFLVAGRSITTTLVVFAVVGFVFAPLFTPPNVFAAFNPEINYQGKLTGTDGSPVDDDNYSITFSLYIGSSGGTAVWDETQTVATVSGLFSVMLGSVDTSISSVNFNQTLYLGVKVGSDSEMTPRKRLGAVPAALEAGRLDGLDSTDFVSTSTTALPNVTTMTGLSTIGTITVGTWQGTPVAGAYGGTGLSTFGGAGRILFSTSGSTLAAGTTLPSGVQSNITQVGTVTSGTWHGAALEDAYVSDDITATNYIPLAQRGAASGVATLNASGKVPTSQLSPFVLSDTFIVDSEAEMLALSSAEIGDVAVRRDLNRTFILADTDYSDVDSWAEMLTPTDTVLSVNGQTGVVALETTDVPEGTNLYYTRDRVTGVINDVSGAANGIAPLDANGKVPTVNLPQLFANEVFVTTSSSTLTTDPDIQANADEGDIAIALDDNQAYILSAPDPSVRENWLEFDPASGVVSVNGMTGVVSLTTTNISEGTNKYLSTSTLATMLSASSPLAVTYNSGTNKLNFTITAASGSSDGYLTTSDWSRFDSKQDEILGAATSIVNDDLDENMVLISSAGGKVAASGSVTTDELAFLDGILSAGVTNALTYWSSAGAIGATTSPTVGAITATSSGLTSSFAGTVRATSRLQVGNPTGLPGSFALETNGFSYFANGANGILVGGGLLGDEEGLYTANEQQIATFEPNTGAYAYGNGQISLSAANNLGIGTTNPTHTLDVRENSGGGSSLKFGLYSGSPDFGGMFALHLDAGAFSGGGIDLTMNPEEGSNWTSPSGLNLNGLSIASGAVLTGGTWNGNTIGVGYGGTGLTSYAVGDLIYASGATTLSKLADVATGNVLLSGGVTTAPAWGKVALTTHVSGTLPVGNGGTGLTTLASSRIPYGNGTSAFQSSANFTYDGSQFFMSNGTNGFRTQDVAGLGDAAVSLFGSGDGFSYTSLNLYSAADLSATGSKGWSIAFRTADDRLAFFSNSAAQDSGTVDERLTLLATGNIGIGTSTPAAKLDVLGRVMIRGANTSHGNYIGTLDFDAEESVNPALEFHQGDFNNPGGGGDSAYLHSEGGAFYFTSTSNWEDYADIYANHINLASPLSLLNGGTGAQLSDPNADRIFFWDDSAGSTAFLAPGNSIAITNTTLDTIQDIRTSASPTFTNLTLTDANGTDISSSGMLTLNANIGNTLGTGAGIVINNTNTGSQAFSLIRLDQGSGAQQGDIFTWAQRDRDISFRSNTGAGFEWINASTSPATWATLNASGLTLGTALGAASGGTGVTSFGGTNTLLYTTSANTLSSISTANTSALVTNSSGVPAWTSGGVANRVLRTDGTTVSFAQVALATDVSGTLAVGNGGTGIASYAVGDLLYASGATTLSKLADVATGNVLISGGVTTAPDWGKVALTTHVSGTLPLANGGTGSALTDPNADRIMFWDDSAGVTTWLAPGNSVAITGTTLDTVQSIQTSASPAFTALSLTSDTSALNIAPTTSWINSDIAVFRAGMDGNFDYDGTAAGLFWSNLDSGNGRFEFRTAGGSPLNVYANAFTAASFSGNGAGITGLSSSNINTGTLAVSYGGTGLNSLTATRIPYGNGTSAFQSSANFTYDGNYFTLDSSASTPAKNYMFTASSSGAGVGWNSFVIGNNIQKGLSSNVPVVLTNSGGQTGGTAISLGNDTANGHGFTVWTGSGVAGTALTNTFKVTPTGLVGIGTTTPTYFTDIRAGTTNGLRVSTSNATPFGLMLNNLTFGGADAKGLGFYQGNTGIAGIFNNNVESINITSTGNVGIGNTAPSKKLMVGTPSGNNTAVQGDVQISGGASTRTGLAISDGNTASMWLLAGNSLNPMIAWDANNLTFKSGVTYGTGPDSSGTIRMILTAAGNLGIATTTAPFSPLTVGTGNIGAFNGAICADNGGVSKCYGSLTAGVVYGDSSSFTASDVAENYKTSDSSLRAGEIVALDPGAAQTIQRARRGDTLLGIVSTAPGVLIGDATVGAKPVALSGRVPLKVTNEGGPIKIGDPVTISSEAGVGMKSASSDEAVGIALENMSGSRDTIEVFVTLRQRLGGGSLLSLSDFAHIMSGSIDLLPDTLDPEARDQLIAMFDGWRIEDGVLYVKEIRADRVQVEDGLLLKDKATGAYYCIYFENGEMVRAEGTCANGEAVSSQADDDDGNSNGGGEDTPTPDPDPETPDPETPEPTTPDPAPDPTPDPEAGGETAPETPDAPETTPTPEAPTPDESAP